MANEHVEDRTTELAEVVGLRARDFALLFGTEWRHACVVDATGSATGSLDPTPWHISGDPAQLMLRAYSHGVFLARPEGVWGHGCERLGYHARDQIYLARHGLDDAAAVGEVIAGLVRRRRAAFRYCRYCRRARGPEEMVSSATCHGCAATWEGLVVPRQVSPVGQVSQAG